MREKRTHGSEGGEGERPFLPLSKWTKLALLLQPAMLTLASKIDRLAACRLLPASGLRYGGLGRPFARSFSHPTPGCRAKLINQKFHHHPNFWRQVAPARIRRVERHRFDVVPVGQDRHQFATPNGLADNDIGQAGDANAGNRQLQHGFRIVGDDVTVDMHDPDAIVSIERPAAQDGEAGDCLLYTSPSPRD